MAFDNPTRNRLQRLVSECRDRLTREFDAKLQELYGIYAGEGRVLDLQKLPHLDDEKLRVATLLRERIEHLASGGGGTPAAISEAVKRLLREQAFTVLNRFAALRMAEERGIIVESVGGGLNSKGFKTFSEVAYSGLGTAYERYRVFLHGMFGELAVDLGVLFDVQSPFGLLFPRENVLLELFELLNAPEVKPLWKEDETIGWIYQYFNDPAERKKMREESAAPRNSRELAVRNQFFTPRYVVEFLTDNTLGRIWYEMTHGNTKLKEQCRYLVRQPVEVFLKDTNSVDWANAHPGIVAAIRGEFGKLPDTARWWEDLQRLALAIDGYELSSALGLGDCLDFYCRKKEEHESTGKWRGTALELWLCLFAVQRSWHNQDANPEGRVLEDILSLYRALHAALQSTKAETQSQEELLSQPVFIPHRPIKDPRTILMLDPACGSMHFGLYAFDLFEVIYEEAWELEKRGAEFQPRPPGMLSLQETYGTKEDFLKDVPRLIIEHNLHGIDIDPRCAQIAGLSLWLRAQKAWQRLGLKPAERPAIKRSNIVCAEPMPGEKELLREFVEREFPAEERGVVLRLLETIFDKMQLAGEAGSLLKIEEEIRSAIEEARQQWQTARQRPEFFEASQLATLDKRAGAQQELPAAERAAMETDFRSLTSEDFWRRIEERIYAALRDYAEQAENGGGFQRRLFAEDAARGFAFIDVCRKRYDVVEMNPPFGESTKIAKPYIDRKFPHTKNDFYAAFVDEGLQRLVKFGSLGAITSRTGLFLGSYQAWREQVLLQEARPVALADLGYGVLDAAMVETAAYVLERLP